MFSCKQTQLTSNFNKRAKKIYVKPSLRNNDIEIALNEKKTPKHSKSISIEVKDTFNYNDLKPKEEFIADAGISEIKVISNENKLHQKLTRIDSVLKSKDSTLIENEEFLELFNKTKKFSLYSLCATLSNLLTFPLLSIGTSLSILFGISLVMTLVMIILTFISTIKIKKYLKKNNKKLRNLSDKKIKYIIRLASIFPLLIISALILSLFVMLTFSISINAG
jgi:hypothetical protein